MFPIKIVRPFIERMNKRHARMSPVHFPRYLLDEYSTWINKVFLRDYRVFATSFNFHKIKYSYDEKWDTINSLLAKHLSDTSKSNQEFRFALMERIPIDQQFRYEKHAKPTLLGHYQDDLKELCHVMGKQIYVQYERNEKWLVEPLWENINTDNATIGILESYILSMFATLQWKYHQAFSTQMFAAYLLTRYEQWIHPALTKLLKMYA